MDKLENLDQGNLSPKEAIQDPIKRIESFQRFGSVLGLERMTRLMAALGDPQDSLRYIHVAGTNGKGSVCRYLYEVLLAAGYSVGMPERGVSRIYSLKLGDDPFNQGLQA